MMFSSLARVALVWFFKVRNHNLRKGFNDILIQYKRNFVYTISRMDSSDSIVKKAAPVSENTNSIKEGNTEIVSDGNVFYNPVQQFNRDLSISVLTVFSKIFRKEQFNTTTDGERTDDLKPGIYFENGLKILEALSATGLRSIRYAKEVPGIKEIIANDLSKAAVLSIEKNIKHNDVAALVTASHSDAMTLMYLSTTPEKRFHAIDLDPYGCPNRFLDGAVQTVTDGGLLLVTATDMAVLAGNTPEACSAKYGTVPLRVKSCHEMAIRILLKCIEGHSNRYGRYIVPLLSISADFYIRVFVRIFTSQQKCKFSMSKQSMVYQCTGCETLTFHPLGIVKPNPTEKNPNQVKFGIPTGPPVGTNCEHCGHKHHLGGPIWTAPIHNQEFVKELLDAVQQEPLKDLGTNPRIVGMLSVIKEELPDVPLYYSIDKLCSVLKLEIIPTLKFRSALLHAGYRVSFSHAYKNSVKTDAPPSVLWDILRCWNKLHPVKAERMIDGTPLKRILEVEPKGEYNIHEIHPLANPESRKNALVRFPENPTPHWGPGTRATIMIGEDKILKSYKNQNKRQKHKPGDDSVAEILPESKQPKLQE